MKVKVTQEWQKLQDLIQALDGQSEFTFDTSTEYRLQVDFANDSVLTGVYCKEFATKPLVNNVGFHIEDNNFAFYQPTDGLDLWVKVRGSADFVNLEVSE